MRRTLLSTLPGLAITAVEIEGVTHEYSTLSGVKETILDVLLALNEVVLSSSQSPLKKPVLGYLKKRGPGRVYARDLRLPNGIQCVDPNHYICTLSDMGCLTMKLQIQSGKGWCETQNQNWYNSDPSQPSIYIDSILNPTDQNAVKDEIIQPWPQLQLEQPNNYYSINNILGETATAPSNLMKKLEDNTHEIVSYQKNETLVSTLTKSSTDTLPLLLNPIFTPIKKINYLVESDKNQPRVGHLEPPEEEASLYDPQPTIVPVVVAQGLSEILILEIWTNGSVLPQEALTLALRSCITTFSKFGQIEF